MKNVLKVPQGMCPLDFLSTQGDKIKNAWLFMDQDVYHDLFTRCKNKEMTSFLIVTLKWEATEEYPSTEIFVKKHYHNDKKFGTWYFITKIQAEDIAFKEAPTEPEEIFFIKMDK